MSEEKRGRGAPPGRRPVIWICSAIVDDELVTKAYEVHDRDPEGSGSFPKEVAEEDFKTEFGEVPEVVLGPFFQKKGAAKAITTKKRLTIERPNMDQFQFDARQRNAIFGSWKGVAQGVVGHPDKIFFVPMGPADDNAEKKNPPAAGLVSSDQIEYLE